MAEQLAIQAIKLASGKGVDRPTASYREAWVEAQITCAEALLCRATISGEEDLRTSRVEAALKRFDLARYEGAANPKVLAVCELHAAQAHLLLGSTSDAWMRYSAWFDNLRQRVEHGFVLSLANAVREGLDTQSGLFFSGDYLEQKNAKFSKMENAENTTPDDQNKRRKAFMC